MRQEFPAWLDFDQWGVTRASVLAAHDSQHFEKETQWPELLLIL